MGYQMPQRDDLSPFDIWKLVLEIVGQFLGPLSNDHQLQGDGISRVDVGKEKWVIDIIDLSRDRFERPEQ